MFWPLEHTDEIIRVVRHESLEIRGLNNETRFQLDGATRHTARVSMSILCMRFFLVFLQQLKARIGQEIDRIPQQMLRNVMNKFRHRLDECKFECDTLQKRALNVHIRVKDNVYIYIYLYLKPIKKVVTKESKRIKRNRVQDVFSKFMISSPVYVDNTFYIITSPTVNWKNKTRISSVGHKLSCHIIVNKTESIRVYGFTYIFLAFITVKMSYV